MLLILGGGLLVYAFYYDVTRAGGFSWDDPAELRQPYRLQIATAHRLYMTGGIVLGIAVTGGVLDAVLRVTMRRYGHRTSI